MNREVAEQNARKGSEAREDILKSEKNYHGNSLLSLLQSSFIRSINHMNSNVSSIVQEETDLENGNGNVTEKNKKIAHSIPNSSSSSSLPLKNQKEIEYNKKVEMLFKRNANESDSSDKEEEDEVHEINENNIDENIKFSTFQNGNKNNNKNNNNNIQNNQNYVKTITIDCQNRNGMRIESFPDMPILHTNPSSL